MTPAGEFDARPLRRHLLAGQLVVVQEVPGTAHRHRLTEALFHADHHVSGVPVNDEAQDDGVPDGVYGLRASSEMLLMP
jgi:hypothetical protein